MPTLKLAFFVSASLSVVTSIGTFLAYTIALKLLIN